MKNKSMQIKEKFYLLFDGNKLALLKQQDTFCFLTENIIENINLVRKYKIADFNSMEYFTAELHQEINWPIHIEFLSLREAFTLLGDKFFPIISKAFQIIYWDKQNQYCGVCGAKTIHREYTWEKHCTECSTIFYPRIAPSIIVLIKKDKQILMARGHHFPQGIYGLIAGFIEPGENIEAAVHREVAEEVGIKIKNLQYYGSQSWPFPNSLMIGFIADYDSGEIEIDPIEIESAGWYNIDNLPGLPSSTFSIASSMIQDFIKLQK